MSRSGESPQPGAPRRMLVTGAAGFIGSNLASFAIARGYRVRTLTRRDWSEGPAVAIADRFLGQFPRRIPREALEGVDVVVHCAASFDSSERKASAVNVEGTSHLARMAAEAGVGSLLFLSSQSARADAVSAYGRSKFEAERRLLEGGGGPAVVILRPGLVTGPGASGLFGKIARLVETLPVVPLLAGGRAIVQPIRVDDLCRAIVRCDELARELAGSILRLGDPTGLTLKELVEMVARSRSGRRKATISIPVAPVKLALRAAEAVGVDLPVSTENIKGLEIVERMDTAGDYARLGLAVRPLDQTIAGDPEPPAAAGAAGPTKAKGERSAKVLLVGAGRVGLIHAATLSRMRGAVLCGIADREKRPRAFLKGLGIRAPGFSSLEEAVRRVAPDAAVVATPPSTHYPLARACLESGVAALVEKPLAVSARQLEAFADLGRKHQSRIIQAGYVMLRNPQIFSCLERLKAGEFGRPRSFTGFTLLSLIREKDPARWEVRREISGGGALINAGGHVLSMIREAFGDPESVRAEIARPFSTQVEDSAVVAFAYRGFSGRHFCSWSIEGHPRQENTLVVSTDRGRLVLTGSVGLFAADDGWCDVTHQLDFDLGFNLAPDYAGGGFTIELGDLARAVRGEGAPPVDLAAAAGIERLLFAIYERGNDVSRFEGSGPREADVHGPWRLRAGGDRPRRGPARILDLRDAPRALVEDFLEDRGRRDRWDGFEISPGEARAAERLAGGGAARVTVPDFLNQARLLSVGRHGDVLRGMGWRAAGRAALSAGKALARERGATFWVAAVGLLRAALEQVPAAFSGTILLHGYLADLALALYDVERLDELLALCRRTRRAARLGFHTAMAEDAANALALLETRVDAVSVLTSPGAVRIEETLEGMRESAPGLAITAEVGLAPALVHRLASEDPSLWAHGAEAVLIGSAAEETLDAGLRASRARAWAEAFPGLTNAPELP